MAATPKIASIRTLRGALAIVEGPDPSPAPANIDPVEQALLINRYRGALDELERKTQVASPDVFVAPDEREISLIQSDLARRGSKERDLTAGGIEAKFGTGVAGGDWWGWAKSLFDWIDRNEAHALVRPTNANAMPLPDDARVAILGDWGTNLYGAPASKRSIVATGPFDLVLHLGDVYYAGTTDEVKERFLDVWPTAAAKVSRALNSNHEMYSGGFGYFDETLPAFRQDGSSFAFQTPHWLLIGLDTAYVDHAMDATQVAWVDAVIQAAPGRKVVLFSHQQLFSRLDKQGPKLRTALGHLLDRQTIKAWYWGHEHQCVIYDVHPALGVYGRCVGHGGIPEPRVGAVTSAPIDRQIAGVTWRRLTGGDSPACLVLDGPNTYIRGEEEKFGPHGYMTLEFKGPALTERVHLPDGTEIFAKTII